jgi:ribosome-associated toxin RatA of RatAB toxin-antitoxin module
MKTKLMALLFVLMGALVVGPAHVAAKPDRAQLESGEIYVKRTNIAGAKSPKFFAQAVVDAPASKVWEIVSNCDRYAQRMPGLRSARLLERNGDVHVCESTTALPFPINDLTSVTRAVHTVRPERMERKWSLIRGDYTRNEGLWRVEPFEGSPQRSLLTYELHAETSNDMPGWVARRMETTSIPQLFERIRSEASR